MSYGILETHIRALIPPLNNKSLLRPLPKLYSNGEGLSFGRNFLSGTTDWMTGSARADNASTELEPIGWEPQR